MRHNDRGVIRNQFFRATFCFVALTGLSGWSFGFAEDGAASSPEDTGATHQQASESDLAAIRAGSEAFVAAFNKRDAKAIAALWTEDGEYIDDTGRRFAGRDAIEKGYAEFFTGSPNGVIRIAIESLRLVSPNTAIEDGSAVVEPAPARTAGISKYTVVHAKIGDDWLMASVRDTWIETPPAVRSAADLEWLIGTWVAEEHGVQTESVCRWVVEGRFIARGYTTTQVDGTKTSGLQLIGWNPQGGHVQSWNFSPDGGHAVGVWTARPGGWTAQMRGVTGDGSPTTSVNRLTRLDDNAYVWQSVQRTVGGMALPDSDEVVLKRQSASR